MRDEIWRRLGRTILLFGVALPGFFPALVAPLQAGSAPARPGFNATRFEGVGQAMQSFVDDKKLAGASVLIAQHGRVIYLKTVGDMDLEHAKPMRRDTIFRIYSMTKPVTAAAVMLLAEQGKLKLDDPVSKYVPEFSDLRVYESGSGDAIKTVPVASPVTIEQLLTHTSGLSYSFQFGTPVAPLYAKAGLVSGKWYHDPEIRGLDDVAKRLAKLPLAFQPGEQWHYSMSLEVAALVVERVSGVTFDKFLEQHFFKPLKMHDTGFFVAAEKKDRLAAAYMPSPKGGLALYEPADPSPFLQPPTVLSGSGGLVSTLDDYFRFAQMLDNGGVLDGVRVLKKQYVDTMLSNHLRPDQAGQLKTAAAFGFGGTGAGLGFGFGGAVVTDVAADGGVGAAGEYSWGGGASTNFWVDRKNDVVVVFMTQLLPSGAVPVRDTLRALVYQALTSTSQ